MNNPFPRSGSIRNRFKDEGSGIFLMKSPNFMIWVPTTLNSTFSRNEPAHASDCRREKRSLTISMEGIRPRIMRSWLRRSYPLISSGILILFRRRVDLAGHDTSHQSIDLFL